MKITFTGDILCQQDMTENSGKNYFPMLEKCDTLFKNTGRRRYAQHPCQL